MIEATCTHCLKLFLARDRRQVYCCREHRNKAAVARSLKSEFSPVEWAAHLAKRSAAYRARPPRTTAQCEARNATERARYARRKAAGP